MQLFLLDPTAVEAMVPCTIPLLHADMSSEINCFDFCLNL